MKWEIKIFDDLVEFPPSVRLNKGESYPFIPMEAIDPSIKYVQDVGERVYTGGGAKFSNGDTIFARITPCLEHGKIVKIKNLNKGSGFGSTEYFVFRAKQGISDEDFIYYLATTDLIKEPAIKSMVGASGRQRADSDVVRNIKVAVPSLNIQNKIASILSAYDELIENNLKQIKLLEEAAQLLYRQWFVNFKFPGHEKTKFINGIPEGWEEKPLSDVCYLTMGQSPESIYYNQEGKGLPFHQGVTNFGFRFVTHEIYCSQENRIAEQGDILCSVRAPVGRLNISLDRIVIGRGLSAIRNKNGFQSFQYYQLKKYFFQEDLIGSGAIFASVTKKQMETIPLLTPTKDILSEFERIVKIYDGQIINLFYQNQRLKEARDILLPRLMDGSIEV